MIDYWGICSWIFAGLALIGTLLNAKMDVKGFYLWIFTNTYFVIRFLYIREYSQSALNFAYLILAFYGIYKWETNKKNKKRK
jgi:nicotinamide riboside transporter PnuC